MPLRLIRPRPRLPQVLLLAALALVAGSGAAYANTGPSDGPPTPRPEYWCEQGEFCTWTGDLYSGEITRFHLRNTNPEECTPLPEGVSAHSLANRIDRHVTVYQDRECATEADFTTYPGPGTFVHEAPFVVRAVQLWS